MSATAESIREKVHHLADELPADGAWKDVLYEAYVRHEIEAGLARPSGASSPAKKKSVPRSRSGECRLRLKWTRPPLINWSPPKTTSPRTTPPQPTRSASVSTRR